MPSYATIDLRLDENDRPRPPVIVFPPGFNLTRERIKPLVESFRNALEGSRIYPPEAIIDEELELRIDQSIYVYYQYYFQAIAAALNISEDLLDQMEPVSRHEFFVCTAPIQSFRDPNELMPGLSRLETLLGYAYPTSGASEKPPYIPSGDYESYMVAAVCLTFKGCGPDLLEKYDMLFLSNVLKDAGYMSDPERKEPEPAQKRLAAAPEVKDAAFEMAKPKISDKLLATGIKLPERF